MGRYVTYLRLSRESRNGRNYGLDAQRRDLDFFLGECCPDSDGCEEIASYQEIQSGKDDDRPELAKAIAHCKKEKATLLVAKLDRLSRRVSFIASLMEQLDFRVAAMPRADAFQLHIYAALAEQERAFISARTKAGIKAAQERGVKVGGKRPGLDARNGVRTQQAADFALKLKGLVEPLQAEGLTLRGIAERLNESKVPTATGRGSWNASTVQRVFQRL